jgi:hypothetical protein
MFNACLQTDGLEHIGQLPKKLLDCPRLMAHCSRLGRCVATHRLFKQHLAHDLTEEGDEQNPSVAAEIEGQDMQCLKDFKAFCMDKLLPKANTALAARKEFKVVLWEVLEDAAKKMTRCSGVRCGMPVRDGVPGLAEGFEQEVVASTSYKQEHPDRCAALWRVVICVCSFGHEVR